MTSHKPRAKDSATAFYQSLFDQNPKKDFAVVNSSDDRLNVSIKHMTAKLHVAFSYININNNY